MASKKPTRRACVYLRISLDQTGEGLAFDRQREDCQRIVRERGWTLVTEYTDTLPSNKHKKRPGYDAMERAYEANEFDALVCYDLDRLMREPRQLEDWIDAAEEHGLAVVTANGEADLTTDAGRLFARVKVAVAKAEVERKAARQRRAAKQRSEMGRPPLGVRLTGYTVKGELVPDEAELVRRIFKLFAAGESLRSIARLLTDEGVTTRNGRPWNPSSIHTILTNPRYAGRAVYQGQPTGQMGNWEPLVSEDAFDLIQAKLSDPRRITNREGTDRKHLGAGLFLCAVCDEPVSSWSGGRYRCRNGAHVNRARPKVDAFVLKFVAGLLRKEGPKLARRMKADDGPSAALVAQLNELRDRQARTEADYDADLIDGRRYASKMERIAAELLSVQQQMARDTNNAALAGVLAAADPGQAFLDAGLMSQRSVIDALVSVRLHKGHHGSKVFDPETVKVVPK